MCRWPAGSAGVPGSVTSTTSAASCCSSSSASSSAGARVDRRLQRLARLVGALSDRTSLLGRELADVAQQVRELGFTAEEAHAHLFELGGCGGGGDRRLPLGAQCGDPVGGAHGRRDPSREVVQGDGGRHGGVQRVGVGDRDVGDVVAGGDDGGRQAFALGAHDERHVTVDRQFAQRRALAGDERDLAAGQLGQVAHARDGHGEQRAHRRAHGLVAVRVGAAGAERDAGRAERQRGADDRADVARVADAPQRDAARPDGRATSAAGRRPIARVPEPSWEISARTCGRTGMPSRPLPFAA